MPAARQEDCKVLVSSEIKCRELLDKLLKYHHCPDRRRCCRLFNASVSSSHAFVAALTCEFHPASSPRRSTGGSNGGCGWRSTARSMIERRVRGRLGPPLGPNQSANKQGGSQPRVREFAGDFSDGRKQPFATALSAGRSRAPILRSRRCKPFRRLRITRDPRKPSFATRELTSVSLWFRKSKAVHWNQPTS